MAGYDILDRRSGAIVGTASTLRRAIQRVDVLDGQYGASRYIYRRTAAPLHTANRLVVIQQEAAQRADATQLPMMVCETEDPEEAYRIVDSGAILPGRPIVTMLPARYSVR